MLDVAYEKFLRFPEGKYSLFPIVPLDPGRSCGS